MSLQRVAPRKNPLLPFVKTDKNGKLTYIRKIPVELRPFLGNKGAIRRTLGTNSTDVTNSSVLAAYGAVHGEVDALIREAEREASQSSGSSTVDSTAIRPNQEQFPLSKRDIAGIAGQVWLYIRDLAANQQLASVEMTKAVKSLAHKAKSQGISEVSVADFAVLAKPTLDELGIDPTPADRHAIGTTLLGYLPLIQADMEKLQQMDFSPPKLA